MDENKENKVNGAEDEQLKKELEELARVFQEELDKAKEEELSAQSKADGAEESPAGAELIQDLEDVQAVSREEDDEEIPEEELCECCGENRKGTKKNPDSPYCYECEKALRHYPFELINIIVPLIAIVFSLYCCYVFSNNIGIYTAAEEADKYVGENRLYTASSAYDIAIEKMKDEGVNGELVYKRAFDCAYKSGEFLSKDLDEDVFKKWELKLPHLKSVYKTKLEALEMQNTQSAITDIFYKYDTEDVKDLPYDKIIEEIEALIDAPAKEMPVYDGETGEEISTTSPYNIKVQNYNKPMILYYEFYIAVVCEKDIETQISFLEKIRDEYPEMTWIYGSVLGDLYNKANRSVSDLCRQIRAVNADDSSADVIEATSLRIKGDYDKSIEICNKFIDKEDTYAYEFLRQKSICYLLKGELDAAYKAAEEAYEQSAIPLTANLLLICSAATDNTDTYNEVAELFKQSDMDISKEILDYKDGKTSLEQIFTKGDFDVV